jgi:hypothetical protein|tara:strand:+ start:260 stop:619 length:360 start_codon:yes stop_codon:yes gene_type:complete
MALGNNAGKGTARHKGQTIRSIKQRRVAKDYTEIQGSAVQGSNACSVSNSNLNVTYFHDSSHASGLPLTAGDKVYTRKRANSKFYAANGHIKVGPDRGRYYNIQITNGEVKAPGAIACP